MKSKEANVIGTITFQLNEYIRFRFLLLTELKINLAKAIIKCFMLTMQVMHLLYDIITVEGRGKKAITELYSLTVNTTLFSYVTFYACACNVYARNALYESLIYSERGGYDALDCLPCKILP